VRVANTICLLTGILLTSLATPPVAQANATVEAVWKPQRISFQFRSQTTFYSCDALHRKLRSILGGLGAHETLQMQTYGCNSPSNSISVHLTVASPVLATEENVRALTTYTPEQQLAARARGVSLPGAADLERFPAAWRTVSFNRNRAMGLGPGDCELVEQIRQSVLPFLSAEVVSDEVHCAPLGNGASPRLTVRTLVAQS
jgi:hypothetical protein